jgi:hypothetical protein
MGSKFRAKIWPRKFETCERFKSFLAKPKSRKSKKSKFGRRTLAKHQFKSQKPLTGFVKFFSSALQKPFYTLNNFGNSTRG